MCPEKYRHIFLAASSPKVGDITISNTVPNTQARYQSSCYLLGNSI
jgi:hypothetical protein